MSTFHNIGFNNQNEYLWTREIHLVKTMGIFICALRTINMSLGKLKHLLSLEVRNAICKR
jgi:hypothetical protein